MLPGNNAHQKTSTLTNFHKNQIDIFLLQYSKHQLIFDFLGNKLSFQRYHKLEIMFEFEFRFYDKKKIHFQNFLLVFPFSKCLKTQKYCKKYSTPVIQLGQKTCLKKFCPKWSFWRSSSFALTVPPV